MKKIILFLVCAISCVGIAFGLNQNSQASDKNDKAILKNEDSKDIDKQENSNQRKIEEDKTTENKKGEEPIKQEKNDEVNNSKETKEENIKKEDVQVEEDTPENKDVQEGKPNQENTQKPSKPVEEEKKPEVPKKKEVSISINAQTAVKYGINKESGFTHIPANGVILGEQKVEIKDGETVFDVLMKIMQKTKLHMEYTGVGSAIYIEGIDNLYEFDCGKFSGWMYEVNGVYPNYGVGAYKVKDGDKITFNYTCDLGKDLGAPVS